MQNLQSKTPSNFKQSYGGTPDPQTPQDAPWLRGPSLKIYALRISRRVNFSRYAASRAPCPWA
jgi:hypothetical protein